MNNPNEQKTYWCIAENLDECLYLPGNIIPCEPYKTTLSFSRDMTSYVFNSEAEAWAAYNATIQ